MSSWLWQLEMNISLFLLTCRFANIQKMPSKHLLMLCITAVFRKRENFSHTCRVLFCTFHINHALVHSRTHKFLPKYTHYQWCHHHSPRSPAPMGRSDPGQRSLIALCVVAPGIQNLAFRCLIDCHL